MSPVKHNKKKVVPQNYLSSFSATRGDLAKAAQNRDIHDIHWFFPPTKQQTKTQNPVTAVFQLPIVHVLLEGTLQGDGGRSPRVRSTMSISPQKDGLEKEAHLPEIIHFWNI